MEIRQDFEAVAPLLHKLAVIGEHFHELDVGRWSHLKNQEDFDRIFDLPDPVRLRLEDLYADGREIAGAMAELLPDFNRAGRYPFLRDYVERIQQSWVGEVMNRDADLSEYRSIGAKYRTPWAIRQMIALYQEQLTMLRAVQTVLDLLKGSELFKSEAGMASQNTPQQVVNIGVIGNVTGRVNVASEDHSINLQVENSVFEGIRTSLAAAQIPKSELEPLLQRLQDLERSVGQPSFVRRYSDFVAAAANHVTVLAPWLPQLSALLS